MSTATMRFAGGTLVILIAAVAAAHAQVAPTIYCRVSGTVRFKPPLSGTPVVLTQPVPQRFAIDGELSDCFGNTADSDLYRTGKFRVRGRSHPLSGDFTQTCSDLSGVSRAGADWRATLKSPDGTRLRVAARIHLVRLESEDDGTAALTLSGTITSGTGPFVNHGFAFYGEIEGGAAALDSACASPTGLSSLEIEPGPESSVRLD